MRIERGHDSIFAMLNKFQLRRSVRSIPRTMGICGSTTKIESTIDVAYQSGNTVPLVQDASANSIPITSLVEPVIVNADPDPK